MSRPMKDGRQRYTKEQWDLAERLYLEGVPTGRIAKALGIHPASLNNRVTRDGLSDIKALRDQDVIDRILNEGRA